MLGGDRTTSASYSCGRWCAATGSTRDERPTRVTGATGSRGAHATARPIGWPYSLVRGSPIGPSEARTGGRGLVISWLLGAGGGGPRTDRQDLRRAHPVDVLVVEQLE